MRVMVQHLHVAKTKKFDKPDPKYMNAKFSN